MPRYAFGVDKEHLDIVNADTYKIENGFLTFTATQGPILSIAVSKVVLVGELDDNDDLPFTRIPA